MSRALKRKTTIEYGGSSKKSKSVTRRIPRSIAGGAHASIFRSINIDVVVGNGATVPLGLAFNSSGVYVNDVINGWPNASDISNAFDAYRLNKVVLEYTYNNNSSSVGNIASTLPYIFTAPDYDDAGGVGGTNITEAAIMQKDGVQVNHFGLNGGYKHVRTLVPKIAVGAYATAATTGYMMPKAKQWVSTGTLGTGDPKHYGMWTFIDLSNQTLATGIAGYLRIHVKAYFDLKHSQ